MNQSISFALLLAGIPLSLLFSSRYAGLPGGKAFLAALGSLLTGGAYAFYAVREMNPRGARAESDAAITVTGIVLCIVLAAAFGIRLWGRWIGGRMTENERQPGRAGIAAWFGIGNVLVGLGIVLTAWMGFKISPLLSATVIAGLLAAYPLLSLESRPAPAGGPAILPPPVRDDLAAEREKILSMLEAGKLTPEESAELLQALGETSRAGIHPPVPLDAPQRLMLIGAALVLLGFFLPWMVINPGKVASSMMAEMSATLPFDGDMIPFRGARLKTPTISVAGGDIKRGLGWMTLLMALAAAGLPYVTSALDAQTLRTVRFLCLGIGGLIVLHLATQNLRFVGIGLILALAGYALEFVGAFRGRSTAAARPDAAC